MTGTLPDLIDLMEHFDNDDFATSDSPFSRIHSNCDYYEPHEFQLSTNDQYDHMSFFHLNCRGLSAHWEAFNELIWDIQQDNFTFDFIGITEFSKCENYDHRIHIDAYHDKKGWSRSVHKKTIFTLN